MTAAAGLLILAWGIQAIVTQSLLLREALVLMFGNELAWGMVLGAWLLGVAGGAAVGGRLGARLRRVDIALVAVLVALGAASCADIWFLRSARAWLGVAPGELLPLTSIALAALLLITPVGATIGMAFPLACRIVKETPGRIGALGRVYAFESAGSLIGGALFSFWAVEHLHPITTALCCTTVTAAASIGLLTAARSRWVVVPALLAVATAAVALLAGHDLHRCLVDRRWRDLAPGYTLTAEADSRYQNLALGVREGQYSLYGDGQLIADFPDPYTYVPLAHFWMCQHPDPKRVLIIGGGAEGVLTEVLRHPVQHVDYVEPDAREIGLIEPYLPELDRNALRDPRVAVHHTDARYFLKTQRNRFDLVIGRLPEPTSAMRARFYTVEFYRELRRAMTDRSVFCMTAAAAPADLSRAAAEYLASIRAGLQQVFPQVTIGWGQPAHVLVATGPGLATTDAAELTRRYDQRHITSGWFSPLWFEANDWFEPDKLAHRAAEISAVDAPPITTDLRPLIYIQRLVLWEQMTGGRSAHILATIRSIRAAWIVVLVAALVLLTLIICRIRGSWTSGAVMVSVGTTGFATMALSIVWLFAFQSLYGYVYQRIGWIIALFMAGLTVGCLLAGMWRPSGSLAVRLTRRLIGIDLLLAGLSMLIPFLLPALGAIQTTPTALHLVEWTISLLVAMTGILGGATFAVAGALQQALTPDTARAAGGVVAADHAGACLGALATGVVLVPVLGIPTTAGILVGTKIASAAVLAVCGGVCLSGRRT
jgi:spermidine synthase